MLDLALAVLCAFRLTQLVVWDGISEPVVLWLSERSEHLDGLLHCSHCTGFWCSAVAVALALLQRTWWPARVALYTLATAGAVSIILHATCWLDPGYDNPEATGPQRAGNVRAD